MYMNFKNKQEILWKKHPLIFSTHHVLMDSEFCGVSDSINCNCLHLMFSKESKSNVGAPKIYYDFKELFCLEQIQIHACVSHLLKWFYFLLPVPRIVTNSRFNLVFLNNSKVICSKYCYHQIYMYYG